jgi:hypothetical protein
MFSCAQQRFHPHSLTRAPHIADTFLFDIKKNCAICDVVPDVVEQ